MTTEWLADQTDLDVLLRVAVALVLGAVIGWERESMGKAAGLRTHMLVAMASAMFIALGDTVLRRFGGQEDIQSDPLRIIEAVVAGVSFLGAGTIFVSRGKDRVQGLTTAASIWITAAIGLAAGLERFGLAIATTVLTLGVLRLLLLVSPDPPDPPDEDGAGANTGAGRGTGQRGPDG